MKLLLPTSRIYWKLLTVFILFAVLPLGYESVREIYLLHHLREGVGKKAKEILIEEYQNDLSRTGREIADRVAKRAEALEMEMRRVADKLPALLESPAGSSASDARLLEEKPGEARWGWGPERRSVMIVAKSASKAVLPDLARAPGMIRELETVSMRSPSVSSIFLWTSNGLCLSIPGFDPREALSGGRIAADWSKEIFRRFPERVDPESPPSRPSWTEAYYDHFYGGGWVSSCLIPIYDSKGRIRAELGVDWNVQSVVKDIVGTSKVQILLLDPSSQVLGETAGALAPFGLSEKEESSVAGKRLIGIVEPRATRIVERLLRGENVVSPEGERLPWMFQAVPVRGRNWTVVTEGALESRLGAALAVESEVAHEFRALYVGLSASFLLLVGFAIVAAWLASRSFSTPLERLTSAAASIGAGGPLGPLPVERSDELGVLSRVFQETALAQQRKIRLLTVLHDIAYSARHVGDLQVVVQELSRNFASFLDAERAAVLVWDPDRDVLAALPHACGIDDAGLASLRIKDPKSPLFRRVFKDGETWSDSSPRESGAVTPEAIDRFGIRSLSAVPLDAEGERIGIVVVINPDPESGQEEIEALRHCADQAGLVLRVARLVRALEESSRDLIDANRQKNYFLQNLNHEIRTPLTAVSGWAEVLEDFEKMTSAETKDAVLQLNRSTTNLLTLVEDLLDMSRVESGSLAVRLEATPVQATLDDVLSSLSPAAGAKGVRLFAGSIEAEGGSSTVWADPVRLRQVLSNLLDNAVKFTLRGGSVEASAWRAGQVWTFSIRDTGLGIPADELPRVFDRFRQVDGGVSRRHRGIGVGLSLARSLVELMGGRIWVKSQLGEGSTFLFSIPVGPPGRKDDRPGTILVTGPSAPVIVESLKVILSPHRRQFESIVTAADLIPRALEVVPDAILFDLDRGDLDSVAATARTLRLEPSLASVRFVGVGAEKNCTDATREALDSIVGRPLAPLAVRLALGIDQNP